MRRLVHAFSGSLEEAAAFCKLGLKIGIGSLLLNPQAKKVRRAAAELPLEHIVLETDSPYMSEGSTPADIFPHSRNRLRLARHRFARTLRRDRTECGRIIGFLICGVIRASEAVYPIWLF